VGSARALDPETRSNLVRQVLCSDISISEPTHTIWRMDVSLSIDLTPEQTAQLKSAAQKLGIRAEDLARAAVTDLLDPAREDFEQAASYVLRKNKRLYERLS